MTRDELLALAARVEALKKADRGFDLAIAIGAWSSAASLWGNITVAQGRALRDAARMWDYPRYTASLDAALTLVPADWHVTVRGLNDSWHVELNTTWAPTAERPARTVTAFCGNEARARTAAALRARAEEISDE